MLLASTSSARLRMIAPKKLILSKFEVVGLLVLVRLTFFRAIVRSLALVPVKSVF